VVKTIELFTRPVRSSRPPIPALVPWIQRSRGQLTSIWSGDCQSKSKLMSAALRRAAHLASAAASRSRGDYSPYRYGVGNWVKGFHVTPLGNYDLSLETLTVGQH
jgi:hypothetical protein